MKNIKIEKVAEFLTSSDNKIITSSTFSMGRFTYCIHCGDSPKRVFSKNDVHSHDRKVGNVCDCNDAVSEAVDSLVAAIFNGSLPSHDHASVKIELAKFSIKSEHYIAALSKLDSSSLPLNKDSDTRYIQPSIRSPKQVSLRDFKSSFPVTFSLYLRNDYYDDHPISHLARLVERKLVERKLEQVNMLKQLIETVEDVNPNFNNAMGIKEPNRDCI